MKNATRLASSVLLAAALGNGLPALAQVAPSGPPPNGPPSTSELQPGANSFTEAQVKSRLETQGYSDVTGLHKGDDGFWRGRASFGGKSVSIAMDYRGAIVRTEP